MRRALLIGVVLALGLHSPVRAASEAPRTTISPPYFQAYGESYCTDLQLFGPVPNGASCTAQAEVGPSGQFTGDLKISAPPGLKAKGMSVANLNVEAEYRTKHSVDALDVDYVVEVNRIELAHVGSTDDNRYVRVEIRPDVSHDCSCASERATAWSTLLSLPPGEETASRSGQTFVGHSTVRGVRVGTFEEQIPAGTFTIRFNVLAANHLGDSFTGDTGTVTTSFDLKLKEVRIRELRGERST